MFVRRTWASIGLRKTSQIVIYVFKQNIFEMTEHKVHSYRRAFSLSFSKFGNNWRYVSTYGGVLPLFVKFSRTKNFVNIPIFIWKNNQETMED